MSLISSRPRIRVGGVPEHFNLPWRTAMKETAFAQLDFDVDWSEFPGGTGAMTSAMAAGDIDIALLLYEGAITNILRGHQNKIVKVYVRSSLTWGIHVAANSSIQTVVDMPGKVYAISRAGSGSHLIAIVDAAERGWSTQGMKFSKVGDLSGAREKLADGKADIFLWEKFTTQPLVDCGEFRRIGERLVPWPAFVVSVREEVLQDHAAGIRQMLEIVDGYCQAFKNSPTGAETVSQTFNIRTHDAERWFNEVQWSSDFERCDATIRKIVGYLQRVDIVETTEVDPAALWYSLPAVGATPTR